MIEERRSDITDTDEPRRNAADYLEAIRHAEQHFARWIDICKQVDDSLADLEALAKTGDPELQIMWANMEVLRPAIYSRPPVPVVVPRWKDLRELPRQASELLERCITTSLDLTDIHSVMEGARDDITADGRCSAWVSYVAEGESEEDFWESVAVEGLTRDDFIHEPGRKWSEVGWVARKAWMTRAEVSKRFKDADALSMTFGKREGLTNERQALVFEVWDRIERRVVWVHKGMEEFLDSSDPWLKLDGFFPCPPPAYSGRQRLTMIPLPDYLYIRDQLEEINKLTRKIHALTEALKVRGFYPGGNSDVGDAIETALQMVDDRLTLQPVGSAAAFEGGNFNNAVWMYPLEPVASTIERLINMRRTVIEDVYQVTGISDILRGATDPRETKGAQEIKAQWGSIRIRNKQTALVQFAKSIVHIVGEIIAEEFGIETIEALAQMELPRRQQVESQKAGISQQVAELQQQAQAVASDPRAWMLAQQGPEAAQQQIQQAQQQLQASQGELEELENTITLDDIFQFIRDERLRPFVLDIETDSTIQPDEQAEKESRNEFLTSMMGYMREAVPAMMQVPQLRPLIAEALKFTAGAYRAGRQLEGAIEKFAEEIENLPAQPMGPDGQPVEGEGANPRDEAMAQKAQAEIEKLKLEMEQMKLEAENGRQQALIDQQARQQEVRAEQAMAAAHMEKLSAEIERIRVQTRAADEKHQADMEMAREKQAAALMEPANVS